MQYEDVRRKCYARETYIQAGTNLTQQIVKLHALTAFCLEKKLSHIRIHKIVRYIVYILWLISKMSIYLWMWFKSCLFLDKKCSSIYLRMSSDVTFLTDESIMSKVNTIKAGSTFDSTHTQLLVKPVNNVSWWLSFPSAFLLITATI